jgi:hypothetical protein
VRPGPDQLRRDSELHRDAGAGHHPQALGGTGFSVGVGDGRRESLWNSLWNVNPYGTFRPDMDARFDLGSAVAVPRPVSRQMTPPGQPWSCDEGRADLTGSCMNEAAWRARDGVGSG